MPFYYRMPKGAAGKRIAEGLIRLREKLDTEIPERTREDTLLLATWNIREFDSTKYGSRTDDAFFYLAEIASRFDLVAIQEVRSNLSALNKLMDKLGRWWKYVVTDVTAGTRGNKERMAFLFDARKVRFGGVAGEVVLPPVTVKDAKGKRTIQPADQLYRTPYLCAFEAGWFKFMISTVHIVYGGAKANAPDRIREISEVARFLQKRATDRDAWSPNLILLGDFNIFARKDDTYKAIQKADFKVPPALQELPGSNIDKTKHYDQIAFSTHAAAEVGFKRAGVFDFYESVFRMRDRDTYATAMGKGYQKALASPKKSAGTTYYKNWRTFQMSDHLPMWIELQVDFGERYLKTVAKG